MPKLVIVMICTVLITLSASTTFAADKNGRFATKGAGLLTCEEMRTVTRENPALLTRFAGWTAGYVSATNFVSDNTFDVAMFETAETIFQYVYEHCARNPNDNFSVATGLMVEVLRASKVQEFTNFSRFHPSSKYQYYEQTVERVFATLIGKGLLNPTTEQPTETEIVAAISKFQEQEGLPVTGDADQLTLVNLLRDIR